MKQSLKFNIEIDENHLPLSIGMESKDIHEKNIKALLVSAWESTKKETLRVDLWTKDMPINEMFIMYHQTLMSMANTLEKSTGHDKLAGALKDYCEFFAEQTKIIDSK